MIENRPQLGAQAGTGFGLREPKDTLALVIGLGGMDRMAPWDRNFILPNLTKSC